MAGDSGLNSPVSAAGKLQVQYLHKIAIAKNPSGSKFFLSRINELENNDMANFMHEVQFYVAIEATIFRQPDSAIDARVAAIFTFLFMFNFDESESAVQR